MSQIFIISKLLFEPCASNTPMLYQSNTIPEYIDILTQFEQLNLIKISKKISLHYYHKSTLTM